MRAFFVLHWTMMLAMLATPASSIRPMRHDAKLREEIRKQMAKHVGLHQAGKNLVSKWNWEALADIGRVHQIIFAQQQKDKQFSDVSCRKSFQAKKPNAGCTDVCKKAAGVKSKWGQGGTGPYADDIWKAYGCA
mmetsp:Transcript_10593/g.20474  ORF Transcript_10593/g.20474 Transcript_10593/m.20474 type:complete len:134 (-) Transcript_10593:88-489(-)